MVKRLIQLRELWGWSQALIAAMLKVSSSSVSRWERGKNAPNASSAERIAALVQALEAAARSQSSPPEVQIIGGDRVGGDQHVGGDLIHGDKISTSDGTTYIIKESLVVVIPNAETLRELLGQ